ncbi:hypothetical protein FM076_01325 [Streptomyces albus subsp. chlorinus]|uniref:hypothetical protein n=1 Tax=Streptomyces albus TaxID=1888 RepID=UPI0015705F24|nr:hypothetical protein [Streptomyces albus]NSC19921.1 hypothetical protein [Streptomyces albus subsp. chlorinus]
MRGQYPPVPLDRGWKGVFNSTGADYEFGTRAEGATTILLTCAKGRPDLLVTVATEEDEAGYDDPKVRLRHARIATATAGKASRKWGCGAHLGKPLRTVGLPVTDVESTPVHSATGTCAGLPGRRGTVTHAWESRRDGIAPLEKCVLGDGRTHRNEEGDEELVHSAHYDLNAYYGAYATERLAHERATGTGTGTGTGIGTGPPPGKGLEGELPRGGYWRTASCPGDSTPAFFTIVRPDLADTFDTPSRGEAAYQRSALGAFTKQSAASHGCTPKTPKH